MAKAGSLTSGTDRAGPGAFPQQLPIRRWGVLRRIVPRSLHPLVRGLRKRVLMLRRPMPEPYRSVFPYTQVHPVRQQNLVRLAGLIENVPGDIVECGVLDGGTAALLAYATRSQLPASQLHLFDSWQGLPSVTAEDGQAVADWSGEDVGSMTRVRRVMHRLQIDPARVVFHRGWFNETFPKAAVDRVSLLHIDADFYESVKLCLEHWYPKLAPGGFVQLDDYDTFPGCRLATDQFLSSHSELRLQTHGGTPVRACYFQKPLQ